MDIKPVSDVLIVKELSEEKLKSGLFVPGEVQKNVTLAKGEVLAAGPGRISVTGVIQPNEFKAGDVIVFQKNRALPVFYSGKEYLFVNAGEVFGSVPGDSKVPSDLLDS